MPLGAKAYLNGAKKKTDAKVGLVLKYYKLMRLPSA